MGWLDALVEARIREAQECGEFDDLPGAGKPGPVPLRTLDVEGVVRTWRARRAGTRPGPTGGSR